MEGPRLGVELELQLPAYATAPATPDPSHICDLHHSSWQCRILNPLSEARNWIHTLMVLSQIISTTPRIPIFDFLIFFNAAENNSPLFSELSILTDTNNNNNAMHVNFWPWR